MIFTVSECLGCGLLGILQMEGAADLSANVTKSLYIPFTCQFFSFHCLNWWMSVIFVPVVVMVPSWVHRHFISATIPIPNTILFIYHLIFSLAVL